MLRNVLLMIYRRLRANETYRDGVLKLVTNDSGGCSLLNKVIFKELPLARDRYFFAGVLLLARALSPISNRAANEEGTCDRGAPVARVTRPSAGETAPLDNKSRERKKGEG